MGMDLHVYVGPYWEVGREHRAILDAFGSVVADGRGEAGTKDDHYCVIPNASLPNVDRQLSFSRLEESPVVPQVDKVHEVTAFNLLARDFCEEVEKAGGTCTARWGIVCGWF